MANEQESRGKLPTELEKKIAAQAERMKDKPDALELSKKSDVIIPASELPPEVEAELRAFSRVSSKGSKTFDVMITNYLAGVTNEYGISKKPTEVVKGLETEMIKAYATTLNLPENMVKELEASMTLGGAKEDGAGAALARDFRRLTGFDHELKEGLLEQKSLDYQGVKEQVLEKASKSLFGNLRADSILRFASTVNDENWKEFRKVPLQMAKKLGLEDQIDDSKLAHRNDIVNIYSNLFGNYANRFRTKYLN